MLPVLVMRTIFSTLDTSPWPFTPGCALPSPPRPAALQIPRDRCNSEGASPAFIKHGTIPSAEIAIDFDRLPTLGVPDIINGNVIVLAPKEWHGIEPLVIAQNVLCCHLPLPFSHYPVLYPNPISRMRIGPARNIARRKHPWGIGFEVLVDHDTAIPSPDPFTWRSGIPGRFLRRGQVVRCSDLPLHSRRSPGHRHRADVSRT
jgi:hypothetical protein